MKHYNCRDCAKEFEYSTGKPGRPPVRCEECRQKHANKTVDRQVRVKTTLSPTERVDRLELQLKSRGLHPSQQKER